VSEPRDSRLRGVDCVERDDVEANRRVAPLAVAHQEVPGRPDDACALRGSDALRRARDGAAAACANLDHHESALLAANEVDLAEPAAVPTREHDEPAVLEIFGGDRLPVAAPRELHFQRVPTSSREPDMGSSYSAGLPLRNCASGSAR